MSSSKILTLYLFVIQFYFMWQYILWFRIRNCIFLFRILVYITSTVAGYNMLQLCKYSFSACPTWSFKGSDYNYMAWISLLVDQVNCFYNYIYGERGKCDICNDLTKLKNRLVCTWHWGQTVQHLKPQCSHIMDQKRSSGWRYATNTADSAI